MTKRQLVVLVFRLFALYFSFNFIESLASYISASKIGGEGLFVTLFVLAAVLFFVSLLWRKSEWLMQKIFAVPSLQDQPTAPQSDSAMDSSSEIEIIDYYETPVSAEALQILAFSLFGLHEVLNAIPQVLREGQLFFEEGGYYRFDPNSILPILFQFVGGFWLLLRPWQLQEWIAKFRPAEESDASHEESKQQ